MNEMFMGSDGGCYYVNTTPTIPEIGYTDGSPFVSGHENYDALVEKKILGFTYGYGANRGEIRSPEGIKSQNLLYELGNNWVCLAVLNYQKTFYSTQIYSDYLKTPTDKDITDFVERAHEKRVKVCLKPMLNSEDGMWRAHIGFPDLNMSDMDIYWKEWFKSYTAFLLHYAELAEELNCEMLCIGCEMLGTEHRKEDWTTLINTIRKVYKGKLVYNTNHGHEDSAEWFDKLDYIGTSAYYPVGAQGITREQMMKEWEKIKWRLNAIAEDRKKKYIFMEIGCRSAKNCSTMPWDFSDLNTEWNEEEQALFYETCLNTFLPEKNFAGVFWWDWGTFMYSDRESAEKNIGYDIHLKAAEQVVKNKYLEYKNKE